MLLAYFSAHKFVYRGEVRQLHANHVFSERPLRIWLALETFPSFFYFFAYIFVFSSKLS